MSAPQDRLQELFADRALFGLSADEAGELEQLLGELGCGDDDSFDLAAAALDRALAGQATPPPAALASSLKAAGRAWSAGRQVAEPAAARSWPAHAERARDPMAPTRSTGAWLAAAAALVLALLGWWPRLAGDRPGPVAVATLGERRAELKRADGVLERAFAATERGGAATGDVLWSPAQQQGFLRIAGLAPNDPSVEQYQLWIFDAEQEHPVDGGVFDAGQVGAGGELIVPIDAKLFVRTPTLFAITVEKPGGVVVSDRERIVLVAEV